MRKLMMHYVTQNKCTAWLHHIVTWSFQIFGNLWQQKSRRLMNFVRPCPAQSARWKLMCGSCRILCIIGNHRFDLSLKL